eukprot:scaffold188032_cov43-Tisochrysis_lutea.AAC.1
MEEHAALTRCACLVDRASKISDEVVFARFQSQRAQCSSSCHRFTIGRPEVKSWRTHRNWGETWRWTAPKRVNDVIRLRYSECIRMGSSRRANSFVNSTSRRAIYSRTTHNKCNYRTVHAPWLSPLATSRFCSILRLCKAILVSNACSRLLLSSVRRTRRLGARAPVRHYIA